MLVFLGLTMWVHNSYDEKLASQTSTRAQVALYASHNCEEEVPEEMSSQLGTKTSGSGKRHGVERVERPGARREDRARQDAADAEVSEGVSERRRIAPRHHGRRKRGRRTRKKSPSRCRYRRTPRSRATRSGTTMSWTAVFGFIQSFIKSGGGIIN